MYFLAIYCVICFVLFLNVEGTNQKPQLQRDKYMIL